VTVEPWRTDCGCPAFAIGGATCCTVTWVSAVLGPPGPVAVRRNVSAVAVAGAVNDATGLVALAIVTVGVPPTCVHWYDAAFCEALPSRSTCWPCWTRSEGAVCATTWSGW
jgi:hypothetical protein